MAVVSGDSTNAAPKLKTTACVGLGRLLGDAAWSEARSWRRCVVCSWSDVAAVNDVSVVALDAVFLVQLAMVLAMVGAIQLHMM